MYKKSNILILILAVLFIVFTGCSKKESSGVSVNKVIDEMSKVVSIDKAVEEDLTNIESAERYGFSTKDIEEGKIYYSSDEIPDKIILIKAKNKDAVENIEQALSSEVIGLTDTWEDRKEEAKKVEDHILKTKDDYILLVISENPKEIEEIFDNMV